MPGSTSKKVIVERFDREPVRGYLSTPGSFTSGGLEVLSANGNVSRVSLPETKLICYVRGWDEPPGWQDKRKFAARPKLEGLWVRFVFRDADELEGIVANRLHELDGTGIFATPPNTAGNTQRIFVPQSSMLACRVLGVIGSTRRAAKESVPESQLAMFD